MSWTLRVESSSFAGREKPLEGGSPEVCLSDNRRCDQASIGLLLGAAEQQQPIQTANDATNIVSFGSPADLPETSNPL